MPSPISLSTALPPLARFPGLDLAGAAAPGGAASGATGPNFQDFLLKSLEQVNELDRQSQSLIAGAMTGEDLTQAEIFTSVKKADLAFRTMLQIRNKLLEAYNELKDLRM
ncbi:MAG: flagellar hook-basal body complex protein FliE [Planctomycetia bacterium]|nr:flagellar hook-basal body complex protein FliE [Planctomycetia bacterium]